MQQLHHYFRYYGLPTDIHYRRFPMDVDGDFVFMQRFEPSRTKKDILLLHGFMEHVGTLAPFIQSLVAHECSVSVLDFQGHGLSGGERHRVDNFREYEAALIKALEKLEDANIQPQIIIGHSTGAGVAAHYVLSKHDVNVHKLILVAPLARSRGWRSAKLGYYAANFFVKDIPRRYRENSSDPTYVEKRRSDPLQSERIPLAWVRAMFEWEARLSKLSAHPIDVDIIQGTDDQTVAWEHNLRFFEEKFPNATITLIENGKHQLLNEGEPVRSIVYHLIHRKVDHV